MTQIFNMGEGDILDLDSVVFVSRSQIFIGSQGLKITADINKIDEVVAAWREWKEYKLNRLSGEI